MKASSPTVRQLCLFLITVSLMASMDSCRPGHNEKAASGDSTSTGAVERMAPEAAGYKPAFRNQTRAPAVRTRTPLQIDVITTALKYPWGIAFLPDSRMLITEKTGSVRIVTPDGHVGDSIGGVPPVHFDRDGGLLDIAIDPDFKTTRLAYWVYSESYDTGYVATIARGRLSDDEKTFENVHAIYRALPAHHDTFHYGTRLLFDNAGYLLACFGERYYEHMRVHAQDLNSPLGKIIRIEKDGKPAPGNPFVSNAHAKPEIWALGFRDPQGMTWNPSTGDLWISDHGPRGGDEIDLATPGGNYGWPLISYGLEYSGQPVNGGKTAMEGMEQPVYYWDPAVAPSGMTFYHGSAIAEWDGNLFVATLRGQHLARLVIENNNVVGEERLLTDYKQRLRSVAEGPGEALYVLTDTEDGTIYRITAATGN